MAIIKLLKEKYIDSGLLDEELSGTGIAILTEYNTIKSKIPESELMAYFYLALAIIAEVIATSSLKASAEFTKLFPSLIVVTGYGIAFYLLTLVLRSIPIGITYAIWSGVGIILVAVVGAIFYKQIPDLPAMIGMALIVSGVVIIHVFSKTQAI